MRKNVLALAFFITLFGISLITPATEFEAIQIQSPDSQSFTMSGIGDNIEDYVDQVSNLHDPTDIGTHDVFSDLQADDTNYDAMTEANQGPAGNDVQDTVDSDATDIDSVPDVGTQGTFANAQDLGDADYMSVQEADLGFAGINENLDCNGYDGTYGGWARSGSSPYLDAVDYNTNYISTSGDNDDEGYFTFPSTSLISGSATVTLYVYCMSVDGNDLASVYYNIGAGDVDTGIDVCDQTGWQYDTVNLGTLTVAQINALNIRFTSVRSPPGSEIRIDYIYINVYAAAVPDYELEFEYQFTSVDFDETNEEVCINVQTAIQDTEELEVYEWDGVSSWSLLGTLNDNGWNNFTASYIDSSTYYIQVRDNERVDESTDSTWNIDSIILHVWTDPTLDYELDLEVGWIAADFDEMHEELCIFPVTGGGWPAEDIKVDVWTGTWTNVMVDLTPDVWNNISISSYLTGTTFEIRFLGGTETGDTAQDAWEIDAVLLHTWTPNYAPVNDQIPTLDNPSDTDNMYAQYLEYQVTVYVSDQNGFADIHYLEIGLWDDSQTTEYCRFRYDEDTNTFTEEFDAGTYVSLNTGSSTATESGNDIDATFHLTIDWDFPDVTDLDANCTVIDAQSESTMTWYEVNWDVETRLDYSVAPSIDDGSGTADRGDLDGSFSLTGTVIYYNSADDYPASTAVDIWVESFEYGTNVGPWNDLTLTSGAFDVTCYADDQVGLSPDTYTVKIVEEGAGSGGTDLYYTTSVTNTYIADRVQVQSYSVVDNRVDVGTSVYIDFTLYYDYDNSPVTDGTITLNTISATDQGSGTWRITDSEAAVTANTYNVVVYSGGTHGISVVDQNGLSQVVIWDQIVVQTTVADDSRVNVGDNVEIQVTLWLAYDSTFLGSADSVTLNGQAMIWNGVNTQFELNVSQGSVGLWTYFVNSSTETNFGITALDTNSRSVGVIWDQILVQTTIADDDRVNINDNVEVRVTLWLAYDHTILGAGDTVTLAGQAMTWDAGGPWFDLTVSQASVGLWSYFVNSTSETAYGITAFDLNSQSVDVIWDQIVVQTTVVNDDRVNIGANAEVHVTLWLAYDSSFLGSGDTVTLAGQAMIWDAGGWFELNVSQASVGLWTYFVNSSSDATYGITLLDTNSQSVDIIWDQVIVRGYSVSDDRVNINDNVDINVTVEYEYDATPVTDGTLTINGISTTYIESGIWQITESESVIGQNVYNAVACASNIHGITSVNQDSQTQTIIWDRIIILTTTTDDGRIDYGTQATIAVTACLEYDSHALGSGDSLYLNDVLMAWNGTHFVSNPQFSQVGKWTFFVNSSNANEATYGISVVNLDNNQVDQIWDRIQILTTVASDGRVNYGVGITTINVTAKLEYDSHMLTSGDTLYLNDELMIWDSDHFYTMVGPFSVVDSLTFFVNASGASELTHGITEVNLDLNSANVIWDQLVVTIGVDSSTPLNGVQVNFTLSVIFDYDDISCTTYQIVIQRNSTWWHSFIDANKSLFVDTNSDSSYTYTVYLVTSESTYDVLSFSTNSQQVVWSSAPNSAPVNDVGPVLINPDDISYMYARYNYYIITSNVSDADGYNDIEYVELTLYDNSRSTPVWTVRYTVSGSVFSIELGSAYIILSASSSAFESGNDLDITWIIKIDWDHADLTDTDTRQYVHDGIIGNEDYYESNWDVETRLEITGLSVDDGSGTANRGPLDGAITVSGTVVFLGSVDNYPLSNETDLWVSSSEYGTNTGPWSNLTLPSGQFTLIAYADDEVGLDTFTLKVVEEAAGSGGADLLSIATESTYIADRIQVQSYSSPDPHVNIGDTITVDVELLYEYDLTSVTDGTVTINEIAATNVGGSTWRISDTNSSVQMNTYDTVAYSGGTHGLSQVNQNAMFQEVIWDQIIVQTTVADDTRVNIGDNVEIRVTLWLAYDSTFLGATDSVTLTGQAMTWDAGGWFELNVSQASVGLWTYFVNSTLEATYGITEFDTNSQSVTVIWDQIVIQTTIVTDSRVDVSSPTDVRVTLWLAYDHEFLGDGDSVSMNDDPMSWNSVNSWWEYEAWQFSVGTWNYFVNSSTESTYGIASLNLNGQNVSVIWDQIIVQTTAADDTRVNVGDNVEIRVTLWLAYDSIILGAADSVTLDGTAMTWDGVNSWFELNVSQASIGLWSYFVNSSIDSTYGITAIDLNSQSVDVIWDRILVQSTVVDDGRVDVASNAEIQVTLMLEYDSTFLGAADSVTLDGTAMTWDSVNSWFELTVSQSTVGAWTYYVNSSTDASYGIDLLDLNGNSVTVIWDRIQVQSYSVSDSRVNIDDTVEVNVTLLYDYDDSPVTDGTITVNGIIANHQTAGVWRFTDSEAIVVMNTYNLVVSAGNTHGLTLVDQNSKTLDVIWDQLVILIGVDDASSLNGHQANFTLTVTYDYDNAICTTYQIVIDRNATWWHSFVDGNVSLFADTNTDATYLYNASLVVSESTYDITAFTTNTLQVTWSLAPNEVPVNDSIPVLTNGDDTDYLYARYRYYVITTSTSDLDGFADLNYVELTLYSDNQSVQYWTIRYTLSTNTFSVESGGAIVVIGTMSTAVGVDETLVITWYIKVGWDHPEIIDSDIQQFVTDGTDNDSDFYETNWNVETRLDYYLVPSLSDDRGDIDTTDLTATGSVTYYGSSHTPLSNETDIWVLHDVAGTWSGDLAAGSFSIFSIGSSSTVRLNTYTIKIVVEGAGSGGTDLYYATSLTDTFITDRIEIYEAGVVDGRIDINSNCEVWWRARYEYDSTEIQSGLTIELNGSRILIWDAGDLFWKWQEASVVPALAGFEVASASESTYELTAWLNTTLAQQVIWDSLVITITDPTDQRINVGANASGIVVSAVYAFDGAVFDGSFILNNTNFLYMVPQIQGYTVLTTTGDSYDITAIGINDVTYCIWDRILVVSIDADEIYHDPSDDVVITAELQYEYDGSPVLAGTFTIASYPLTHIESGVWEVQVTLGTYNVVDFDDLTTCDATLHGISEYNMDSNSVTVYWDRLEFYSVTVDDDRINVGASADIQWGVRLENAAIPITAGITAQMTGDITLTLTAGALSATVSQNVVGSVTYSILVASLGEISQFVQSASDVTVIWDRVLVTSITATELDTLDTGTTTEIHVTLIYEFDSTDVETGQVYLDDNGVSVAMSYNSGGGYWSASIAKNTAGTYTFTVVSVSGNTYGITSLDDAGLSVEVEWVRIPGPAPDTMTLMLIGGGVGIAVIGAAIVASRRRKAAPAVGVGDIEVGDFGVEEPDTTIAPTEPEAKEPVEPEVVEEPEIEAVTVEEAEKPEEVEIPPVDEELAELETEEAAMEPEAEVVEEIPEPEEIEPPVEEELDVEPEPEVAEYHDIPEEFIEPEVPVDLSKLTKKELLDLIPDDIKETTSPSELKRLSKQELISLVESFRDGEE